MHLIFERSESQFKSNCNILALAWMPYYVEHKFRQALFDYHQKQLINLSSTNQGQRLNGELGRNVQLGRHSDASQQQNNVLDPAGQQQHEINRQDAGHVNGQPASTPKNSQQSVQFLNSRIAELYQRYTYLQGSGRKGIREFCHEKLEQALNSGIEVNQELSFKYGCMQEFGWLAIGNVGKVVGITLTSIVQPPKSLPDQRQTDDLMVFNEENSSDQCDGATNQDDQTKSCPKGGKSFQSVELNQIRPDRPSVRDNYNLRGHLDEIILVKWNELYQKLATIDSKGNVLIWCKVNEKFTIQTPFYNRTKSVADFKWSNDGKTALICYTDSFILVGSSSGQRHWHSMLNLDDYHITCASWTPHDEQLLLGVSNGNIVVIDLPRSELTELVVNQTNIRTMCWSSCDISFHNLNNKSFHPPTTSNDSIRANSSQRRNSTIVNHRRLSRDCSVFSRYRFSSTTTASNPHQTGTKDSAKALANSCIGQRNILAIDFANNTIKLYEGGLDDSEPCLIHVDLESYIMAWSSNGRVLAVAGFNIFTSAPSAGCLRCRYSNLIKFYNQQGGLIYEHRMSYTRYPITAFTWAHNDQRIFVATGPRLHCAKVYFGIPSLSLLAMSCLHRHTQLSDKTDILEGLVKGQFCSNVLNWRSFNCPINLQRDAVRELSLSVPSDKSSRSSNESGETFEYPKVENNSNILRYQLPAKLKTRIDELFTRTIRQPFEEQLSLNDMAWHVPKNDRRFYCTLICYSSELVDRDIGTVGYQYNNANNLAMDNYYGSDQNKIFVLYIEFQGSLVPILRARRIGFLKPEFVIFDPEENPIKNQQRHHKVSDVSSQTFLYDLIQRRYNNHPSNMHQQHPAAANESNLLVAAGVGGQQNSSPFYHNDSLMDNCSDLHMYSELSTSLGRQSLSDAEHYYNFDQSDTVNRQIQDKLIAGRSHHQEPIALPISSSPYLLYWLNNSSPRPQGLSMARAKNFPSHVYSSNLSRRHKLSSRASNTNRTLPESSELVRVRSNIWGTKFKLINVGNRMIKQRAILGSVTYKASILHLQPRQIFLDIKDMSNYCILCSTHHHSRLESKIGQLMDNRHINNKSQQVASNTISLIDMPIIDPHSVATTPSNKFGKSHRDKTGRKELSSRQGDDKVVVSVGDGIRIAPKLERNQKYKFAGHFIIDNQRPSTSSGSVSASCSPNKKSKRSVRHRYNEASKLALNDGAKLSKPIASTLNGYETSASELRSNQTIASNLVSVKQQLKSYGSHQHHQQPIPSTSKSGDGTCNITGDNQVQTDDDILTLTLDQGDQVKVEMSTMRGLNELAMPKKESELRVTDKGNRSEAELEGFLEANKTLKSIQTITQMIVALSSKASADDDNAAISADGETNNNLKSAYLSSPTKIFKPSSGVSNQLGGSSRYIPPETPVHRPRRSGPKILSGYGQTQSVTTTPLKTTTTTSRWNKPKRAEISSLMPDTLPPPPPSIPIGRKLSSSAKRFLDGSLRSLYGNGSGYSTGSELEPEECEPLVAASRSRNINKPSRLGASQPNTPLKNSTSDLTQKHSVDLNMLKTQLLQKLRGSGWRSNSETKNNDSSGSATKSISSQMKRAHLKKDPMRFHSMPLGGTSLTSDSVASRMLNSPSSSSSSCSAESSSSDDQHDICLTDTELSHKQNKVKRLQKFASAKNLNSNHPKLAARDLLNDRVALQKPPSSNVRQQRRHRRHRRKSICPNSKCCCAREFKLNNRPPVWNELSQVYQLDFGGRVTQESAKNLQIDFDGSLALQFGRIDKCTYTLDYKYPFNAVQAMAIALASLTQRLK